MSAAVRSFNGLDRDAVSLLHHIASLSPRRERFGGDQVVELDSVPEVSYKNLSGFVGRTAKTPVYSRSGPHYSSDIIAYESAVAQRLKPEFDIAWLQPFSSTLSHNWFEVQQRSRRLT